MPSLHKVLATSFTCIRDNGVAPDSWGSSKIILIKKNKDDPDDEPSNYRMISLTQNIEEARVRSKFKPKFYLIFLLKL
jgi:hypothetical protein